MRPAAVRLCPTALPPVLLAAMTMIASSATASADVTLFDVSFGTPTHVAGEPPTLGGGDIPRDTASRVTEEPPIVFHGPHPILRDALIFRPSGDTEQEVRFSVSDLGPYRSYTCTATIVVQELGPTASASLQMHTDEPFLVTFNAGGNMSVFGYGAGSPVDGGWEPGTPIQVDIDYDAHAGRVRFLVDGKVVGTRVDKPSGIVRTFRTRAFGNALVAVEHVRVRAEVDETLSEVRTWSHIKDIFAR